MREVIRPFMKTQQVNQSRTDQNRSQRISNGFKFGLVASENHSEKCPLIPERNYDYFAG